MMKNIFLLCYSIIFFKVCFIKKLVITQLYKFNSIEIS